MKKKIIEIIGIIISIIIIFQNIAYATSSKSSLQNQQSDIDNQIKEFENIKKQEKYDELKFCFDNYIGDMADIIKFDKILNPKWGNATAKIDTLKAEIEDNIEFKGHKDFKITFPNMQTSRINPL